MPLKRWTCLLPDAFMLSHVLSPLTSPLIDPLQYVKRSHGAHTTAAQRHRRRAAASSGATRTDTRYDHETRLLLAALCVRVALDPTRL